MTLAAWIEQRAGNDWEWRLAAGGLWASAMLWDAVSSYVIQTSTLGSWRYDEVDPLVAPIVTAVSHEVAFLVLAPVGVLLGLLAIWRVIPRPWMAVVVELGILGWINNTLCCSSYVYRLVYP